MGLWGVLKFYDPQDGTFTPHAWPGSQRVVSQHQRWTAPEGGDVPEFTIEAAYKTHDHVGNPVTPGWRYILKWLENGQPRQTRDYGFIDKDAAVQAAKYKARGIARSLAPVHIETYTPEV